jgi:hypothetical protein
LLFIVNVTPSVQTKIYPQTTKLTSEDYQYTYISTDIQNIINDMNNQLLIDTRKARIALANRWLTEFSRIFGNQLAGNLDNQVTGLGMDIVSVANTKKAPARPPIKHPMLLCGRHTRTQKLSVLL